MDFQKISSFLTEGGFIVSIKNYSEINFRTENYSDSFVLYQSAEDIGLKYKGFIDDIILGLKLQGAILIPEYPYFKAHHNKVFMEILRDISMNDSIKNIKTQYYGTKEDFLKKSGEDLNMPLIIKTSEGAGSRGVLLARNIKQCIKFVSKLSRTISIRNDLKDFIKRFYFEDYVPYSCHRNKFIIQNFIPNLSYDFKILVFYSKIYILKRGVRKNDFRASGSGLFEFPENLPNGILSYAYSIFKDFNVPFISLDIAFDGTTFYLIEFQFIDFGTYTLEKSHFYHKLVNNDWIKTYGRSDLETIFSQSILDYISYEFHNV
jgi:hypothetical protein